MREHVLLFCLLGLVLTATILLVAAPGAVTWALALHRMSLPPPGSHLGSRWPSRLVATAEEDRLNIKRNLYTSFAAASDCRTVAIYEYTS
jgi:hypothetical protein